MNKVVGLLTLCVVFAILRAAVVALTVALLLAFLWSFITRPRETLVFAVTLSLMALVNARPIASIIALGVVGVAVVLVRSKGEAGKFAGPDHGSSTPPTYTRLDGDGPR